MKKSFVSLATLFLVVVMGVSSVSAQGAKGSSKKDGLPPGIQKRFIEEDQKTKEYDAMIEDIDLRLNRIVIEEGTAILNLLVSDSAKIKLNNKDAKLEDLKIGDLVELKLDKENTIIEIKATGETRVKEEKVEGKIMLIHNEATPLIVVKIGNEVQIFFVDKNMDLSKFEVDDRVIIYTENNKVTSIKLK